MWLMVIIWNQALSRSKDNDKIVSWTNGQRPSDDNRKHSDKNNSRDKQHSHSKMSLAEDY